MSAMIRLLAGLLCLPSFAAQQVSVPKIGPMTMPMAGAPSLAVPSWEGVEGLPALPESALPGAALAAPGAAAAAPAVSAAQPGARAPLPIAARAQLDSIGAQLSKQGASPAASAQGDVLGGAFDHQGSRSDSVSASDGRPATVYHLQHDGVGLGAQKRGHQDFRFEEVPFPVPDDLKADVPSARQSAPANWTGLISLHLHSIYSDGTLSPTQLMDEAFKQGVRIVSLTDHDSTAGLAEAKKRAEELGMTFIAGEEMTARGGVHIGALGIDPGNPDLIAHNERVRQNRLARAQNIIDHLNARFRDNPHKDEERGLVLTLDEVKSHSQHDAGGTIEIPAIARVLLDHHLIEHVDDAYDTYLTSQILSDPGIQPDPTVEEVLEVIHKAGGKAFLNHPYTVRAKTPQGKDEKVKDMLSSGFEGIEAYRDSNAESPAGRERFDERTAKYLSWAKEDGLLVGNGADYHGPDTHLNHLVVNMPKHYANDLLDGLGIPEAKALVNGPAPDSAKPAAALLALPAMAVAAHLSSWPIGLMVLGMAVFIALSRTRTYAPLRKLAASRQAGHSWQARALIGLAFLGEAVRIGIAFWLAFIGGRLL